MLCYVRLRDVSWLSISVTTHVTALSSAPATPLQTSTSIVVWLVTGPTQDASRYQDHSMLLIVGRRSLCTDILFRQDDSSAGHNLINVHIFKMRAGFQHMENGVRGASH